MRKTVYKALLVDFYGTLVQEDDAIIREICGEIAVSAGVPTEDVARFWVRQFRELCNSLHGDAFRLQRDVEQISIEQTLERFGVSGDPVKISKRLFKYWRAPDVFPDAAPFLAVVRIPVCLVSNIDNDEIAAALVHTGISVDHIVTSEDCRSCKPRSEMFEKALSLLALSSEEVLHIGDSLSSDVAGANRVGIRTVWLNRNKRLLTGDFCPDYQVSSLKMLDSIIQR